MSSPIPEGFYRIFNGKTKGALWLPKADDGTLAEVADLDESDNRFVWQLSGGDSGGKYTIQNYQQFTYAVSKVNDGDNVTGRRDSTEAILKTTSTDLLTITPLGGSRFWGLASDKDTYPIVRDSGTDKLNQWQFKRIAKPST